MAGRIEENILILFATNHTLVHRNSVGIKSNNNTTVRSGATELVKFLLGYKNVHIVFYSNMSKTNAFKNTKFILNGTKTKISIKNKNLMVTDGSFTTENKSDSDYYVVQDKKLLVNISSHFFGKEFRLEKTVVIDYSRKNVEKNPDISVVIDPYNGTDIGDNCLGNLKDAFNQAFVENCDDLADFIRKKMESNF